MNATFKICSLLVIASMLLAACGIPAEAGLPPEFTVAVAATTVAISIPMMNAMTAEMVLATYGPWVGTIDGIAIADEATGIGILDDPIAATLTIIFLAQLTCSAIPECREAEARLIITSIDELTLLMQRWFPGKDVVISYGGSTVLTWELALGMSVHEESEELNRKALEAATAGVLAAGFSGPSGCYFRLKASLKAIQQGIIYGIVGIECNNQLSVIIVGIPVATIAEIGYEAWAVNGGTYWYDPAAILFRTSYISSSVKTLTTPDPATFLTVDAGWAQALNGRWSPYVDVLTIPLPGGPSSWMPGRHRWDGGVTP